VGGCWTVIAEGSAGCETSSRCPDPGELAVGSAAWAFIELTVERQHHYAAREARNIAKLQAMVQGTRESDEVRDVITNARIVHGQALDPGYDRVGFGKS